MPLFSHLVARCLLVLSLFIGSTAMASAHDLIQQRAYWEDTSAQASFAQAQQHAFTPYDGVLSRGYTQSATWVRIQIAPPEHAKPDDKLALRIRPIYLDQITLFDPLDTSGKVRTTGDQTEYKDEEYRSLSHAFVIPAGTVPRFVWLRIQATSTTMVHVQALTLDDMNMAEHALMSSSYFTLSLISLFFMLGLINWFNTRESLYAAFAFRNFFYLIYTAAFFGLHRYLLSDVVSAYYMDWAYNWLVVGATAITLWFETRFLSEYKRPKWVQYIFMGYFIWSGFAAALLCLGFAHHSVKYNMMLNGVGIISLLVVSVFFIKDQTHGSEKNPSLLKKKFIVSYYTLTTGLMMFSILPYLGNMAGSEFAASGLMYYAIISGLNIAILMDLRARQRRKAHEQMSHDLALSEQQVLIEKNRHEESTQLLTMLMHELKNPLAVIDLAQHASEDAKTKEYVTRNVAIIRNVLDQCLNTDRLSDGKININKHPVDLAELIDELIEQHQDHLHRFKLSFSPVVGHLHAFQTDYQCLRTVLNNLIDNAVRYGDPFQPIDISVTSQHNAAGVEGLAICVSNKPGLASWPEAHKLFHKYYRSAGAKTISGTGLGLFLVRSLCGLLDGTCTYEPDDTHIRFKVWLPN